ncbi:cytochrome d ubiquinol oxidase subunit II [Alicyclobacillus ferrooxydans]|uniref:Cytochrome D ubiquinol oxidase subunit II n=1 Tax=Alicyclobacillus ferrooxydans TaxID=471514 RepID=A0A0P9ENZ3_9BACL|nr:cytochrome d ubiquinol oxidase subunit II [Alicyclobacillus ferrooxydans]KPV45198.1 hypothetical protein AN477_03390 [Alicyclobacillus ferrooxydans]
MNIVALGAAFIWAMISIYTILGGIDFGSSFWRWYFSRRKNWEAEEVAHSFVSPTWELVNSFLVLIPVAIVGLFPGAAYAYGSILLIPASMVLGLLILRGAYWQFGYASEQKRGPIIWVVGLTGLILPGLFATILGLSQGGYVSRGTQGAYVLPLAKFLFSPQVLVFLAFGILMALYLSALFLAQYAKQAGSLETFAAFRRSAQWVGPLSAVSGILAIVSSMHGQLDMSHRLVTWWPILGLSFVMFLVGYAGLFRPVGMTKVRMSLWATVIQLVLAQIAYGCAHYPYVLYPYLTFSDAASNHSMFVTTLVIFVAGFALLAPGFYLFRSLFIKDVQSVVSQTASRGTVTPKRG